MAQLDGSLVQAQGDPELPPTLPVGAEIGGKYRVVRVLGRGGNGAVYEGEHTDVGHRVAIKVAHHKEDERGDVMTRFRREARICGSLRHPHVGQVFDVGTVDDGAPYMVMELQEGRSLSDVIDETQLPFAAIIDISRQLLAGLSAAHQAGTIHLDVKPDNVMLVRDHGGDLVVKLVDFGISRRLIEVESESSMSSDGFVVGSPDYMPPEQLRGERVDVRTDLYAVGVLLYEAIAHRPPFDGATTEDLVDAVLAAPVPPLTGLRSDCPPELERVVRKAMSREPSDRYQTAEEMSRALAALRITARATSTSNLTRLDAPVERPQVDAAMSARQRSDTAVRRRRTIDQRTLQTVRLGARKSVVQTTASAAPHGANVKPVVVGVVAAVAVLLALFVVTRSSSTAVTVSAAPTAEPTTTTAQAEPLPPPTAAAAAPIAAAPVAAPSAPVEPPPVAAVVASAVTTPIPTTATPPDTEDEAAPEPAIKRSPARRQSARAQSARETEKAAPERPKAEPVKAAPPPPPPKPEQDPTLTRVQLREAQNAFRKGQIPEALKLYRQIAKVAPSSADAWRGLAVTANRNAERAEAERALRRYLQLRPGAKDAATILQRVK